MRRVQWPILLAILSLLQPTLVSAHHDDIPNPAPATTPRKLEPIPQMRRDGVTVSGLSSGAFFAHQFHVAHSKLVVGAGLLAGGPYGCVETISNPYWRLAGVTAALDRFSAALVGCSHIVGGRYFGLRVDAPRAEDSVGLVRAAWDRRVIDDPDHLRGHRVWIFHGKKDDLVPAAVTASVAEVYRRLGVAAVATDLDRDAPEAAHGMPVTRAPADSPFPARTCGELKPPFIIQCGFSGAEALLRHLYPAETKPASPDPHGDGAIIMFDQSEFTAGNGDGASLAKVGFAYVPRRCGAQACHLHVAFHGCLQNAELVHDDWVRDAGYNAWAAANDVVVIYPQTTRSAQNPSRCWDFWGYAGEAYADQTAPQIRAVKGMVDRVLGLP